MSNEIYKFVNEYGEKFELVKVNDEVGILKGDETDWKSVYLVNGYGLDFNIFGEDEKVWLSEYFSLPSMSRISTAGTIKDGWTSCIKVDGTSITFLCPVCMEECDNDDLERHHVIEAMLGGSDGYPNNIKICKDCHSLVTKGKKKNLYSIRLALLYHQLYHFGFDFFFCQRYGNTRYKDRHIKYYEFGVWNLIKNFCAEYGKMYLSTHRKMDFDNLRRDEFHAKLMNDIGMIRSPKDEFCLKYHFFRQVFLGIVPWKYISKMIDEMSVCVEGMR